MINHSRGKWDDDGHPTPNPTPRPTNKPTNAPTKNPTGKPTPVTIVTPAPSPAPTTCEERKFYVVKNNDQLYCSNGYDIPSDWAGSEYYFDTLQACCEMQFGGSSCVFEDVCVTPSPTESPVTPAPTPCGDQVFFFDGNICSNDFYIADAPAYNTAMACCNANFGAGSFLNRDCNYIDICNTLPPSPSPTIASTFGSTPTVSKETTGPPTMYAGRGDGDPVTVDVTTDCREITGGYPEVCVKVCTYIKSSFEGGKLIDETAETTEEECD